MTGHGMSKPQRSLLCSDHCWTPLNPLKVSEMQAGTLERAHDFTVYRIILGDMVLNWVLAVALMVFPGWVDNILGQSPILPPMIYRMIGLLFALFAAWQTWIVTRGKISVSGLVFAAVMALVPVIML